MKRVLPILMAAALLIPSAAALPSGPAVDAASVILMEKETGTILHENNSHEQL